jgi:LacI family transcriptional regulator
MAKRATLKDVADRVGVTPATVSMVINNHKSIPPVTRDRVMAAVRELGYYPNPTARNLVKGKSDTIAVISEFLYPLFFQQLLDGIEHVVARTPYALHHLSSLRNLDKFNDQCRSILSGRVADGVIVFNKTPAPDIVNDFKRFGIPLVIIENDVPGGHSILCNNFRGGYLAGEHLARSGRKKILCVTGPEDPSRVTVQHERVAGFAKALSDNGLQPFTPLPVETSHFYFAEGKTLWNETLKRMRGFDAVFCAVGDPVAVGMISAMLADGVAVPGEVSVVGYDDLEFTPYVSPPLTTIRQPGKEMGRRAAEIILERLASPGSAADDSKVVFEPELIVRGS